MSKKNIHEDKYHNTDLSIAVENNDIKILKSLLEFDDQLNAVEILKSLAIQAYKDELLEKFEITRDAELKIYYEVKDQLDLIGQDISQLLEV